MVSFRHRYGALSGSAGLLGVLAMLASGCSTGSRGGPQNKPAETGAQPAQNSRNAPGAIITITYSRPHDYLESLSVTEFTGAHLIASERDPQSKANYSIVRFDGGQLRWQIGTDRPVGGRWLAKLRGSVDTDGYSVPAVKYGAVPEHFFQVEPPNREPPQTLQSERYYLFTVERGSGSLSLFIARGRADGKLAGYDAEPRAGSSYALCCNVSPDFAPQEGQESTTPGTP